MDAIFGVILLLAALLMVTWIIVSGEDKEARPKNWLLIYAVLSIFLLASATLIFTTLD